MAGQLYGTDIDGTSITDWLAAYTVPLLRPSGYVEIWTSINDGYEDQTLLGTFKYVSGTVKIDRSNIIRRTATDIVILNDIDNDPGNNLLPIAGTDDGWFSPYGNEMRIYKGFYATAGTSALVNAPSAVSYPVTIVTGVNDQFVYTSTVNTGGVPDTFAIPAGTYLTDGDLQVAILNAIDGSLVYFYTYTGGVGDSLAGGISISSLIGSAYNGDAITEGNGAAALMGFSSLPAIYAGGTDASGGYAQLGVFLIDEVDINRDSNGMIFSGTMSDRMEWLSRLSFQYAWSDGLVTENITEGIFEIILNAATSWTYPSAPFPVSPDIVTIEAQMPVTHYNIGDDPAKLATDLAAAYGCVLYFDCTGTLCLDVVPDPSSIAPCVEYLANTSTSPYSISRAVSNQNVPNVICVTSGGTKAAPSVTVWWWDSYPGSPTFYADAPADWTTPQTILPPIDPSATYSVLLQKFSTTIQQGNADGAQAMALAIGLTSIGSLEKSTFGLRDQPAHDIDDVITIFNPIAGIPADTDMAQGPESSADGFNYILDQVTIDLTAGGNGTQAVGRLVWAPPT